MDQLEQIQQQQQLSQYMTYGFVALVAIIVIYYIVKGVKNKSYKMGPENLDKVMTRELNKLVSSDDKLVNYIDVAWRPNALVSVKGHTYYLGLTQKNIILIKVKSHMGMFTDTNDNITEINAPFSSLKNFTVEEDTLTEYANKQRIVFNVKKITFKEKNKDYTLVVKPTGLFENNFQLGEILNTLTQNCS